MQKICYFPAGSLKKFDKKHSRNRKTSWNFLIRKPCGGVFIILSNI